MQEYKKISSSKVLPMEALAEFEASLDGGYEGYVAEEKFDGSRFGVVIKDGEITFLSSQGKDRTVNVPDLVEALRDLNIPDDTILDCEVVHLDAPKADRWEMSRAIMGTKDYRPERARPDLVIFDVQRINGIDLTDGNYSFADRREVIKRIFKDKAMTNLTHTTWRYGQLAYPELFTANTFSALFLEIHNDGGEGIMVKDLESTKYGKSWIKVKMRFTVDAVVMNATEGTGKYEGTLGALELGLYDTDGTLVPIGKCSGMSDEERDMFYKELPDVIEVKAFEVTKALKLRFPAFNRVREDKTQGECKLEQLKEILNATRK